MRHLARRGFLGGAWRATLTLCLGASAPALTGCHGSSQAASPNAGGADAKDVAAFATNEDELLRTLAAVDRRIAFRARTAPREDDLRRIAMTAVLAEDPSLAVVDGAIDPFSFEARARGLASADKVFAQAPTKLPAESTGTLPEPALERELLARLLREESVRLQEERDLPRSASSLLNGVVATWTVPASPDEATARDRWLARRLGELEELVRRQGLEVVRARELDDTLDALEHVMDAPGLGASTAKLVEVRRAIEEAHAATPEATPSWNEVSARLDAHLGLGSRRSYEELKATLAKAETALRAAAQASQQRSKAEETSLFARVPEVVFPRTPCVDAVPGSRVRSMTPSPERLAICQLKHALSGANDDAQLALALLAMHEQVVVAEWALEVLHGTKLQDAVEKYRPMTLPTPDTVAHWERAAMVHPVAAIGAGLAAALLMEGDPKARAKAWVALGDLPLDLAAKQLGTPTK